MVVSDNGTNFRSVEFHDFLRNVGVKYHKYTAPYHPATNGQAERNVQKVKNALKAMCTTRETLRSNIKEFLRQYRNAPHHSTGQSPAQLLMGRQLRTRLDLVRPEEIDSKISSEQYLSSSNEKFRQFERKQAVYFLSGNPRTDKWLKGIINKQLGDIHYEIRFRDKIYTRHVDQIRKTGREQEKIRPTYNWSASKLLTDSTTELHGIPMKQNTPTQGVLTTSSKECNTADEPEPSEGRENGMTPQTSTGFKGFSETTPYSGSEAPASSTPKAPGAEQKPDVRRSTRNRKPRILFSP